MTVCILEWHELFFAMFAEKTNHDHKSQPLLVLLNVTGFAGNTLLQE
jgi:hypothetical protein